MNRLIRRLAALLALTLAPALHAQESSRWLISLGGGSTEWTDNRLLIAAAERGGAPRTSAVVIRGSRNLFSRVTGFEWGTAFASYKEESRLNPTHVAALDWRLAVQTPWTRLQPFAGAGPSAVWYINNDDGRTAVELGYNAGGGVRVRVQPGLYVIGDARLRAWDMDGFDHKYSGGEVTLSLAFRP